MATTTPIREIETSEDAERRAGNVVHYLKQIVAGKDHSGGIRRMVDYNQAKIGRWDLRQGAPKK